MTFDYNVLGLIENGIHLARYHTGPYRQYGCLQLRLCTTIFMYIIYFPLYVSCINQHYKSFVIIININNPDDLYPLTVSYFGWTRWTYLLVLVEIRMIYWVSLLVLAVIQRRDIVRSMGMWILDQLTVLLNSYSWIYYIVHGNACSETEQEMQTLPTFHEQRVLGTCVCCYYVYPPEMFFYVISYTVIVFFNKTILYTQTYGYN